MGSLHSYQCNGPSYQGFSEISDVKAANGGSFENVQESFLFAEVLKDSYLIHAPVSILKQMQEYVD